MTTCTDPLQRDRWARLRFSIIGPLLAAPPAAGELYAALTRLAAKVWRHPSSGLDVCFGVSTLERWYYAARRAADPVAALKNRLRGDIGQFPSLSPTAITCLETQYREHPGWTMQLHYDNLRVARVGCDSPLASYPTVRRYLKAQGMFRQARPKRASDGALLARDRLERLEVRSFEVDHVGALWHLDFHHGSRRVLTRVGTWVKPMLFGVIDDRSRLVCHLQWYLDETAESLVHGLCQAFMKRGLPRALMTDNGAAMLAAETVNGLAILGVLHQTTLPYSPYRNAKQESFWGRIEGRLMAMLEGEASLSLDLLNQATQAWVEQEYHRTLHSELDATPLARYLDGPDVRRECPGTAELAAAFRIEVARRLLADRSLAHGGFTPPPGTRMNQKLLALYGLKWNPFSPELPTEAVYVPPRIENFCWRIEHAQIREGGFAMIHGDPGTGKSVALRLLSERLARLPDVTVGAINHPQSNLADFYREMGDIFAVPLRPHNRWGGFKALREVWFAHLETTRRRAILLIDEAQEMSPAVLCELRLLASARFDSQSLLCVVLAGDARLIEKLRREELIPLGSRIRTRLATEHASREELQACLGHLLAGAGNASLMTQPLQQTLCDHAAGNYRILTTLAAELLAAAAQRDLPQLDEKLYLDVFAQPETPAPRRVVAR